jgi:hypothetical protein
VKNCAVEFNFGQRAEPYCSVLPGFTFIQHLPLSERIRGTVGPKSKAECEVSGTRKLPKQKKEVEWLGMVKGRRTCHKCNLGTSSLFIPAARGRDQS